MRRIFARVLCIICAVACFTSTAQAVTPSFSPPAARMLYNDTEYKLNVSAAKLLKALGKDYKLTKQPSCLYEGEDKAYKYASLGITVHTVPKGGTDTIEEIYITKSTFTTVGGLKIGDTVTAMEKLYGKKYETEDNIYIYNSGRYYLIAVTKNSKITAISLRYDNNEY